jgi:hypothetical protein
VNSWVVEPLSESDEQIVVKYVIDFVDLPQAADERPLISDMYQTGVIETMIAFLRLAVMYIHFFHCFCSYKAVIHVFYWTYGVVITDGAVLMSR